MTVFKKGLTFIEGFLDEDNQILSLENLNIKFDIAMPFVTYLSIVRQIRVIIGRENLDRLCRPIIPQYLNIILAELKDVETYINVSMHVQLKNISMNVNGKMS